MRTIVAVAAVILALSPLQVSREVPSAAAERKVIDTAKGYRGEWNIKQALAKGVCRMPSDPEGTWYVTYLERDGGIVYFTTIYPHEDGLNGFAVSDVVPLSEVVSLTGWPQ
jgi:hypothetical protein